MISGYWQPSISSVVVNSFEVLSHRRSLAHWLLTLCYKVSKDDVVVSWGYGFVKKSQNIKKQQVASEKV